MVPKLCSRGAHLGIVQRRDQRGIELSMIGAGVPAGASTPSQLSPTTPAKPCSTKVGTSGKISERSVDVVASALSLPARHLRHDGRHVADQAVEMAGKDVGDAPAPRRDRAPTCSLDAGRSLEQLQAEIGHRAAAGDADGDGAGLARASSASSRAELTFMSALTTSTGELIAALPTGGEILQRIVGQVAAEARD